MRTTPIVLLALLPSLGSTALSLDLPGDSGSPDGLLPDQADAIRQGGIASIMNAPLIDDSMEEGTVWVRNRSTRARFDASGGAVYPVFGKASPREWPVQFDVASVEVGGESIAVEMTDPPTVDGTDVIQRRAGLTEVHRIGLDGIEQTFVFDELPQAGELVLRMTVETDLNPVVEGDQLRFSHEAFGHVAYGKAFAFDGAGKSTPIERQWTGESIDFRVPASFVADAVLPLTIDPVWTSFSNGFGVADDADPSVLYAGATNQFLVVWNEYTSAQNLDVYASRYASNLGSPLEGIAIEISNDSWHGPACAYSYGADRALIAAVSNPGTGTGRVAGRLFDVGAGQLAPGVVTISSVGATSKEDVDVGGSNADTAADAHFCVTWSRGQVTNQIDVEYRILEADGTPITGISKVNTSAADEIQPAISQGVGDADLSGDNWHIVWTEDYDNDGRGAILAKRIYFSGNASLNSDAFSVTADALFSHPTISSLSDETLQFTSRRGAVLAFERAIPDVSSPSGFQTDILLGIVSDEQVVTITGLTDQEDVDSALQQRRPVISTNGRSFYVAYLEEDFGAIGSGQWDVYLAAGEITPGAGQVGFALAERHVILENTSDAATELDIYSRWEGEHNSTSSRCLCVWAADLSNPSSGFGQIRGAGYQYPLTVTQADGAVGVQYCDANPNSGGAFGGRQSSWMRVLGTAQLGDLHRAQAIDLPQNAFAYLLTSLTFGDQNLPGGSAGHLCLGGSVGRYIGQVQSSGVSGTVEATIDPMALPQPNGSAAALPGERWRFQFWHRDTDGGMPTSNFTNGVSVRFMN